MTEAAQPMFRTMIAEPDGLPAVGRSARKLGVRVEGPHVDLPVGKGGEVEPRAGGMSVAMDAVRNLPKNRLPKALGGEGRDPVFRVHVEELTPSLTVRPDPHPHGLVEPAERCPLEQYESALGSTRIHWTVVP